MDVVSFLGHSYMWRNVSPQLQNKTWECLALDMRLLRKAC